MSDTLDELCVNTIRFLPVDAVQQANSGHPGLPLGSAPMAYALWTQVLEHNPRNPWWFDRDRFVLSAGHGSMRLYSSSDSAQSVELFESRSQLSKDHMKERRADLAAAGERAW